MIYQTNRLWLSLIENYNLMIAVINRVMEVWWNKKAYQWFITSSIADAFKDKKQRKVLRN